ncbi:MAG TPA: lactonase family protein [Phycisphaerae bacterium]|nr:lactonase family protein [Phycisphaerae bacterium]HOM50826.1 lactonase family protein [Phycisphaerae bacterium]HOQ87406.1 lactonase family protein [Phycisphaerae bacterium]HPP25999.1 lactonase family protein [Phycisphaerae bacterium]
MKRAPSGSAGVMGIISCALLTSAMQGQTVRANREEHVTPPPAERKYRVYVGTYTSGASEGIYLFELDRVSGALEPKGLAAKTANPSFLALGPGNRRLYAVGELDANGGVSAFAVDAATGKLELLNRQPSGGRGPCHLCVDPSGRHVLVANYSSGSAAVLPIASDGSLAEPRSVVQHEGSGPDPKRQQGPHAHSVHLDAAGRFAFVADLGLDRIFIYRFDASKGTLGPHDPPSAHVAPAAGPRHLAFHPSGRYVYVNNEMGCTVTAFKYDAERGTLSELQVIGTLPEDWREPNTTAEILVHPSGKFLYCSNRGHDSIAIFTIDPTTGRLTAAGHQSTSGATPRNFGIDPAGQWLIAANQKSDTLQVFRIASESGRLEPAGSPVPVPTPVCVKFVTP